MKLYDVEYGGSVTHEEMTRCIVQANSPRQARKLAAELDKGFEGWLDPKKTTCKALVPKGSPAVLLTEYWYGARRERTWPRKSR